MICSDELPKLEDVIAELEMTASVKEILPVDKTWYHYTEEGVLPLETDGETETVTEGITTDCGIVEGSDLPKDSEAETDSPASTDKGCGSAFCGSAAVAAAGVSTALMCRKKKEKK